MKKYLPAINSYYLQGGLIYPEFLEPPPALPQIESDPEHISAAN